MTRYIGVFIPFFFISSPSITTVLEKITTILTLCLNNRYSLFPHYYAGICVLCTPSQLPFSIVRMRCLTILRLRCVAPQLYNGYVVDVDYCTSLLCFNYSLLCYYRVLYYKDYYYYSYYVC